MQTEVITTFLIILLAADQVNKCDHFTKSLFHTFSMESFLILLSISRALLYFGYTMIYARIFPII